MSLILRNAKGSPLTWNEMDDNLSYLEGLTNGELTPDELEAIQGANAPSSANTFATMSDLGGGGGSSLSETLAEGNETGGNSIVVSDGDSIIPATTEVPTLGTPTFKFKELHTKFGNIGENSLTMGLREGTIGAGSTVLGGTGGYPMQPNKSEGDSSLAAGSGNYAKGMGSTAFGVETQALRHSSHSEGQQTIARGIGSHAEGHKTKADNTASHSGGYGAISWDFAEWSRSSTEEAQYGILSLARLTTNATPVILKTNGNFVNNGLYSYMIKNNTAYRYKVTALALDTGRGDVKEWTGDIVLKNIDNDLTSVGPITLTSTMVDAEMEGVTLTASIDNDSYKEFNFEATGEEGKNIRWFVKLEYVKINF